MRSASIELADRTTLEVLYDSFSEFWPVVLMLDPSFCCSLSLMVVLVVSPFDDRLLFGGVNNLLDLVGLEGSYRVSR